MFDRLGSTPRPTRRKRPSAPRSRRYCSNACFHTQRAHDRALDPRIPPVMEVEEEVAAFDDKTFGKSKGRADHLEKTNKKAPDEKSSQMEAHSVPMHVGQFNLLIWCTRIP